MTKGGAAIRRTIMASSFRIYCYQNRERLGWEDYVLDNNILELISLFLSDQKMYRKEL
jgi:hypothetical protein